jgi:hypothetical protein
MKKLASLEKEALEKMPSGVFPAFASKLSDHRSRSVASC